MYIVLINLVYIYSIYFQKNLLLCYRSDLNRWESKGGHGSKWENINVTTFFKNTLYP